MYTRQINKCDLRISKRKINIKPPQGLSDTQPQPCWTNEEEEAEKNHPIPNRKASNSEYRNSTWDQDGVGALASKGVTKIPSFTSCQVTEVRSCATNRQGPNKVWRDG